MAPTITDTQSFEGLVDGWMQMAVARGFTTFDQLLARLPGVYPPEAFKSLQRLVAIGKIPSHVLEASAKEIRQAKPKREEFSNRTSLPVPHPLDYDWRFSEATTTYLLNECLWLSHSSESIALLGAPTIFRTLIERSSPRRAVLFDNNPTVINCFSESVQGAQAVLCDLLGEDLPRIEAAAIIVDSPWYDEYLRGFMWAATNICQLGGHILISLPPLGTRPGVDLDRAILLDWANQLGLTLVRLEQGALTYVSSPFEINALKAEGFFVSDTWRRGDLAVFQRLNSTRVPRPLTQMGAEDGWFEEAIYGVRMRVRPQEVDDFVDPRLISIVPGDILSSVSRRDIRRSLVDVWTSGNRVFACRGRRVLQPILRALGMGREAEQVVAVYLGRQLSAEEQDLVTHAAQQINEIVELERCENQTFRGI